MLIDVGGQDATEAFEDVGHSDEAREVLEGLLIGNLKRQVNLTLQLIMQTKTVASEDMYNFLANQRAAFISCPRRRYRWRWHLDKSPIPSSYVTPHDLCTNMVLNSLATQNQRRKHTHHQAAISLPAAMQAWVLAYTRFCSLAVHLLSAHTNI